MRMPNACCGKRCATTRTTNSRAARWRLPCAWAATSSKAAKLCSRQSRRCRFSPLPWRRAFKVGGQPLYRSARRGVAVNVPPRRVTIYDLRLLDYRYPELDILVECSSGTYIRTLAADLGAALGAGGYLHALLRTRVGRFGIADAWRLDELERRLSPATFSQMALHPDEALAERQTLLLDSTQSRAWYDGRPVRRTGMGRTASRCGSLGADGRWLGVGALDSTADQWLPRLVVGSS